MNAEDRGGASAGVPPTDGSTDRYLETSASALGSSGRSTGKRGLRRLGRKTFWRGVQTAGCRGFEVRGRSRGCLIACASSPYSQRRIYDTIEPRRTANSSVASIVNCAGGGCQYRPALDRVSADRRAYCIRRLLQVTLQRPGPLGVTEGAFWVRIAASCPLPALHGPVTE